MDHSGHPHPQGMTPNYADPQLLSGIDDFAQQFVHNGDYDMSWNPQQFESSPENTSTFGQGQQSGTAWHQNTMDQPNDQATQPHHQQPSTYQTTNFHPTQRQFEPRPPSQAQTMFDARAMSQQHQSPSPAAYQNYPYQQPYQYLNTYAQQPQQGYRQPMQPTTRVQQRQNAPTPSFSPPPQTQSPYMQYAMQPQQPQQTFHMGVINFSDPNSANPSPSVYQNHFSTSPAQHQQQLRQATSFVDPSLLNANNFPSPEAEQQFQNGFQQLHRPTASPTPALGHPQSHMQIPAPTSQAQHVSVVVPDINGVPQSVPPEKIATKPLKKKDPNAPKRPRGRPRKDGLPPKAKAPGAASPSGTESDDLEIEEPPESRPTILDDPVPQDREQKATYDTVQAVWSPRNKGAIIERVRNGIALYGELVKRLRDDWKTQNEALKKAELSNAPTDELKRQVAHGRKILQTVMETTLDKGHPAHITKLGENHWTIIALREFLVDRIVATDWDGSLVRSILKVMAQFTTLEQEMLEKTKMEKALSRFAKKSDQEIKILVQRILENAAAASKRKAEKAPSPEPRTVSDTAARTPQLNSSGAKDSLQLAGTKRSRDEAAIQPAAKKPAPQRSIPEASKPLALQNAALKKSESSGKMAKPDATVNGSTAAAKAKPTHPTTTKPAPSVFSTLMSASKKPGTSNAARAAAAAAAAKEKEVKSVSSPTPAGPNTDSPPPTTAPTSTPPVRAAAPSFSFSQTLAGLNKPKEVEEKSVEAMPEETPEEKAKRLRKEARRKLRVTWKSDDTLTEVRLFSHHPDEEVGHADSMIRDVDDVGGEGRMLKMHKDLDELDEDEEAKAVGEDLYPYSPPSVIEFDGIDEEMLKSNFIKRGGMQEPDSPEKAAQEQREQISLMVIYALPSDVPPSPKEPPAVSAGEDYEPPVPIGEPLQPQIRERETKYYANIRAHNTPNQQRNLSDILGAFQPNPLSDLERTFNQYSQGQQSQPHQTPVGAPGEWDFSKLLGLVHQTQQQVESQPIVPQAPAPNNDVSAILANFQPQPSFNLVDLLAQAGTQNGNLNPYGTNQEDPSLSRKHGLDDYDPYEERKKKSRPEALGVNGTNNGSSASSSSSKRHPKEKTVVCRFWNEGKCKKGDDCTYIHD